MDKPTSNGLVSGSTFTVPLTAPVIWVTPVSLLRGIFLRVNAFWSAPMTRPTYLTPKAVPTHAPLNAPGRTPVRTSCCVKTGTSTTSSSSTTTAGPSNEAPDLYWISSGVRGQRQSSLELRLYSCPTRNSCNVSLGNRWLETVSSTPLLPE